MYWVIGPKDLSICVSSQVHVAFAHFSVCAQNEAFCFPITRHIHVRTPPRLTPCPTMYADGSWMTSPRNWSPGRVTSFSNHHSRFIKALFAPRQHILPKGNIQLACQLSHAVLQVSMAASTRWQPWPLPLLDRPSVDPALEVSSTFLSCTIPPHIHN
jgi:hypothetical protein